MPEFVTNWWWALLALAGLGAATVWFWRGGSKPTDIKAPAALDSDLRWDNPEESLKKVYDYVVAVNDDARRWYQSRRQPKRKLGFALRLGALTLTVAAGLVPLYSAISPKASTVMLAIAGLF